MEVPRASSRKYCVLEATQDAARVAGRRLGKLSWSPWLKGHHSDVHSKASVALTSGSGRNPFLLGRTEGSAVCMYFVPAI
jgi:hypothetical protein